MARWNHFSEKKYQEVKFTDLKIGDKFRKDFHLGKRRRTDIICIKTEEHKYIERRSKTPHWFVFLNDNVLVSSFDKLAEPF